MRTKTNHTCSYVVNETDGIRYCLGCNNSSALPQCEHLETIGDFCTRCREIITIAPTVSEAEAEAEGPTFIEYIDFYDRDLVSYQNNNLNYLTNLLPNTWREIARLAVKNANYKFITRTVLKTLPLEISYKYVVPKIANAKNKIICRDCGRLFTVEKIKHNCSGA